MIRQHVFGRRPGAHDVILWRGAEVSRLEALSDAVFGFAITLLVVSLEVPATYAQLAQTMQGFVAFAASFALLFLIWFHQYRFFRRYGLEDSTTVLLNAVLLFVVVFFVYPLKFVFKLCVDELMGRRYAVLADGRHVPVFTSYREPREMMVVFGLGYVAVFFLFALMHVHAHRRRHALALDACETFETATNVREALLNVGVGLVSIAAAALAPERSASMLSGLSYFLVGPVMTVNGFVTGRLRRKRGLPLRSEVLRARSAELGEPAGSAGVGELAGG
jgi:low temperature requirement protein LtrA